MGALITVADLQMQDGEPTVEDLTLARALALSNVYDIRTLIRRHMSALNELGAVTVMQRKPSAKGGRPSQVFYLNEEQAIFITAKSDTPRAAEITVAMVRVFRAYLQGKLTEKPVKARAHRRAIPAPQSDPAPSGSDILRDLYKAVVAANVRVERGFAPDFGVALEGVLLDMEAAASGCEPGLMRALMGGSRVVRDQMKFSAPLAS